MDKKLKIKTPCGANIVLSVADCTVFGEVKQKLCMYRPDIMLYEDEPFVHERAKDHIDPEEEYHRRKRQDRLRGSLLYFGRVLQNHELLSAVNVLPGEHVVCVRKSRKSQPPVAAEGGGGASEEGPAASSGFGGAAPPGDGGRNPNFPAEAFRRFLAHNVDRALPLASSLGVLEDSRADEGSHMLDLVTQHLSRSLNIGMRRAEEEDEEDDDEDDDDDDDEDTEEVDEDEEDDWPRAQPPTRSVMDTHRNPLVRLPSEQAEFYGECGGDGGGRVDDADANDEDDYGDSDDYCFSCGASAVLVCTGCHAASYCSPICQQRHWRAHKRACRRSRISGVD